jgi:HAD superfamily 5'-nucleotidase-like hydrolase
LPRTEPGAETAARGAGPSAFPPERDTFCNRTLNLRAIRAVGYDMDYTLVHYKEDEWERRAYEHTRARFLQRGWPVGELRFDPLAVNRGLTIDLELGNLVKPNRFGYIIKAAHGTRFLDFETQRRTYSRTIVDLAEDRFVFLNTLFSYSEACIFAQLVDLLDEGRIEGVKSYSSLYEEVRSALDEAHMQGALKAEIIADPDRFVVLDPWMPLALLDQKQTGKKLLLITNSEWEYTRAMMPYVFDRFLPEGMPWRDLFDVIIVSASKPRFFSERRPLYRVVDEDRSLLEPTHDGLEAGGVFFGGSADAVEEYLRLSGEHILYVGDHLFGDVHVSKAVLRWRTALILRELESEVRALAAFEPTQRELGALMREKEGLERRLYQTRLRIQRVRKRYGPVEEEAVPALESRASKLRAELAELDERIAPLAQAAAGIGENVWGPLMRAGNDKSLFARQVERYADVYTSRVSNLLYQTPFGFLRAPRGSLPHDPL